MAVELATAYVSIVPSVRGLQGSLTRELNGATGAPAARAGQQSGSRFVGGFKKAAAAAGGLFAAAKIGGFAKDAIAAASDVSESTSKVGVVFGKQASQIVKASKTSADAMGLSSGAYLEAAGTLGNLLVSLKIAPKAAADMSQQMVKLAGDLASFNNVSPEEALAAIKSGLTGETEPLKAFGVNMNDATLHSQALKLGLIKTTKDALTPQTKALAAQALIMDQTKTAQGDFGRTSKGLANQQRILAAQFDNVKAKVGAALLPVMVKLANFMSTNLLPAGNAVGGFLKDHQTLFKVLAVVVGLVTAALVIHKVALVAVGVASKVAAVWTGAMTAAQWLLNAALDANPIGVVILAIGALVLAFILIKKRFDDVKAALSAAWNAIRSVFIGGVRVIVGVFLGFVSTIIHGAASAFGWIPGLGGKLKTARDNFDKFKDKVDQSLRDAAGSAAKHPITPQVNTNDAIVKLQNFSQWYDGYLASLNAKGSVRVPTGDPNLVIPGAGRPGHATGGYLNKGWNWTGERGPELIYNSGQNQKVFTAGQSAAMMQPAGGTFVVELTSVLDGRVVAKSVTEHQLTDARRA